MRVFPEGFFYTKKNDQPRTTKMNTVFVLIARLKGNTGEKETGTSEIIFRNSGWVEGSGRKSNFLIMDLARFVWLQD
jgi:hypothetical protein